MRGWDSVREGCRAKEKALFEFGCGFSAFLPL